MNLRHLPWEISAVPRARRRDKPRLFLFRWAARLSTVPELIVYFTQYVSWYGTFSLYEQHAFLVPVPFLGI